MDHLPLFEKPSLSVSDLTRYLRELLDSDDILRDVWVQGEISNLSRPSSGHIYFTLKDESSALHCVMWRTSALRLRVPLQNGLAVEAHGKISVYERDGQYQLYADSLRQAGEGFLYQEFLRLKARLEAEGLFDEEHKRPLPAYPQRIGIVTSPTGAALQDMLNTLAQRYPMAEVTVAPTAVQGEDAPAQIVAAIQALNRQVHPDVILLARGGGSLEDLWAFNDEQVVRAVVASTAPVVTGVGHETDFTLVDFASDLRAPTPTGAAVLITPNRTDLMNNLATLSSRLVGAFAGGMQEQRASFREMSQRLAHNSPLRLVQNNRQSLDALWQRCEQSGSHALQLRRAGLNGAYLRLNALSPLAVLQRGYAILSRPDGTLVTSIVQTSAGEALQVRLADGRIDAAVTATHPQVPTRERKES